MKHKLSMQASIVKFPPKTKQAPLGQTAARNDLWKDMCSKLSDYCNASISAVTPPLEMDFFSTA